MNNGKRIYDHKKLTNKLSEFIKIFGNDKGLYKLVENRNYQELHHKICQAMFKRAENEEELWIRIDEQEDMITLDNIKDYYDDEEKKYCRVSIVTKTMLDYDVMMLNLISEENTNNTIFENEYAINMYKPYFYNFLIDITEIDRDSIHFLTNSDNINQWFVGRFADFVDREGERIFPGYIEKIASPAEYKERKIIINDKRLSPKTIANINNTYDLGSNPCSSDADIKKELDYILEMPELREAKIYNIGNANCVYLKGRNSFGNLRLLYDIGYYCTIPSKKIKKVTYKPTVQAIRKLKPDCIILSHWDSDHFYGCAYADYSIFRCKWFAPNLDKNSTVSAKRVAKYLQVLKNLILVDRISGRQVACVQGIHSKLKIFMGEKRKGKDDNITDCNKEGIILELANQGGNIHTLMTGDVPYESLPSGINFSRNTPYDYLVVPHHGAKMEINLLSKKNKKQPGYAIICAKPKRSYATHTDKLKANDYIINVTGDAGLCIIIDLLSKNAPKKRP